MVYEGLDGSMRTGRVTGKQMSEKSFPKSLSPVMLIFGPKSPCSIVCSTTYRLYFLSAIFLPPFL
jgi:hypothetical protein